MTVLGALADGRALPVGTLAAETGLSPAAVRGQIAMLVADGLVETIVSEPYRYHRLTGAADAGPPFVVRSLREGSPAYDLRLARRCYGHLAGRLGVAVTDALRTHGWVEGASGDVDLAGLAARGRRLAGGVLDADPYRLTTEGAAGLGALGVRLPARLGEVRCCVDWTEQRHHLAGPLGAALLDAFVALGWVGRSPTARALTVSAAGAAGFARSLGVGWPPPARADLARLPRAEFGFPGPLRDRLVAAILRGDKVSTTTLLLDYEVCGDPLPRPGDRALLVDSRDVVVALLETAAVAVVPLRDVDAAHARDEGEGHLDVPTWRRAHEEFWHSPDMRAALGDPAFTVDDSTPVVLERFRVVWRYVPPPSP
jgi:uncharacterized protein YhfF